MKKVPFQSDLNKIKVSLGILCIVDYDMEFTKELASLIDINQLNKVYGDVKDKEWLKEVDVRLKHLISFLKSIKENLGPVVVEIGDKGDKGKDGVIKGRVFKKEARHIAKRFGKEEIDVLVSMFGGGFGDEEEVD